MRRPKTFIICCVILLAIVASGVIIPWVKREQTLKQIKEQHEAELEILAAYPWIDEIDPDNIAKLTSCEGDIVYTVTDKEAIAEIMGIIRDTNPQPVIINPEDDKGRPAGGPKNALWLDITTKDDKESWSLTIDDENFPTDFVIDHTVYKNKDTNWFETKTGYFTKPDKIYRKVKAIMYKGERTDLNEVSDTGQDGSSEWNRVDFEYNPDAIFTAETLTLTDKEGLYTTDVKCAYGKYFFTRIKVDEDLILSEISYEDKLRFKYFWGYMDENGDNETEFALKSTDPEKPYCGIHKMLGVTEDRVYAMTFQADENDYFSDKIYYLTAFDMSGNVVAEKQYPYKIDFYPEVQSLITKSGDILVYNGATALFDEEFNEIALNTDHRIIMVAPTENDEIAVLLKKEKGYNRAILDGKDLSIVSEDDRSYDLKDYRIVEMPDQSTLIMVKFESEGYRFKLVELSFDVGYETEIIDSFHSGINGRILGIVSRTRDEIILKTEGEQGYVDEVNLVKFTGVDRDVAAKRKPLKVLGESSYKLCLFNAMSKDYYAEDYYKTNRHEDRHMPTTAEELRTLCVKDGAPDVIYLFHAEDPLNMIKIDEVADLSGLLKEDGDVHEEQFFPGIIKSLTYKGSLRAYPVTADLMTIVADSGFLKGEAFTYDKFSELLLQNEGKTLLFNVRRYMTEHFIGYYGNPFYSKSENICNFDTEDFKSLIKMIKNLYEDYEILYDFADRYTESGYGSMAEAEKAEVEGLKKAGAILSVEDINGWSSGFYFEHTAFGDNYEFVGFPTKAGGQSCFKQASVYVINDLSENKKGALEYIKSIAPEHAEDGVAADRLLFDKTLEEHMSSGYYQSYKDAEIHRALYEKAKEVMETAEGFAVSFTDEDYDFIHGAMDAYFAGLSTEDETAKAFQEYFSAKD